MSFWDGPFFLGDMLIFRGVTDIFLLHLLVFVDDSSRKDDPIDPYKVGPYLLLINRVVTPQMALNG